MKLKALSNQFHQQLDIIYGKDEVNSFLGLLNEHYLKLQRIDIILNPEIELSSEQVQLFLDALDALTAQKPIQYIIGKTEFYGLTFAVNEHTLIPRPETEELVDFVLEDLASSNNKPMKILDIGTGTGCIPISLAKNYSNSQIFAIDISEGALKVAQHNADLNDVKVEFFQDDIMNIRHNEAIVPSQSFDVIVSNPPYVRQLEKAKMKPNVLDYEPHLALFVEDDNALQFYKAICEYAKDRLVVGGALFFEINEYLGQDMIALLKDFGFNNIELRQDVFGKDRMIKGVK